MKRRSGPSLLAWWYDRWVPTHQQSGVSTPTRVTERSPGLRSSRRRRLPPALANAVVEAPRACRAGPSPCRRRAPEGALTTNTVEVPSASNPVSTTGSASPRCGWSVQMASRSASSPSATRCGWPRKPISTSSRWQPKPGPPVCKLMDYGKWKYENAQKAREARRNQSHTVIKEMKLRPKIDPHDYETKKGHVVRFLKAGDKVKITIMFRGREQSRPELGFRLLQRLAAGRRGARLRRVRAEAGRPQHDHGDGPASQAAGSSRHRTAQRARP